MKHDLTGMTQEKWDSLSALDKKDSRDLSGLTVQLLGLENARVEVLDKFGDVRRFWVGRSTGWRPCHLEVATRRSDGGMAAAREYERVSIIDRGPR